MNFHVKTLKLLQISLSYLMFFKIFALIDIYYKFFHENLRYQIKKMNTNHNTVWMRKLQILWEVGLSDYLGKWETSSEDVKMGKEILGLEESGDVGDRKEIVLKCTKDWKFFE